MRLQQKCFPVTFAQFLRTPILKNICEPLLLSLEFTSFLPLLKSCSVQRHDKLRCKIALIHLKQDVQEPFYGAAPLSSGSWLQNKRLIKGELRPKLHPCFYVRFLLIVQRKKDFIRFNEVIKLQSFAFSLCSVTPINV